MNATSYGKQYADLKQYTDIWEVKTPLQVPYVGWNFMSYIKTQK